MNGVRLDVAGATAVITIDRPERRNAIDAPTAAALAQALDELDGRDDLVVAILTGAGSTFCAGMDLKALNETGQRPDTESRGMFGITGRPPQTPLIAAVEGAALGGGLEIALACDLIVAARDARFGFPEVKRGLVPAAGGAIRLGRRIPPAVALELMLTGEPIDAPRAQELGLVNRLCEPQSAVQTALAMAEAIAANAPLALRTVKAIAAETATLTIEAAFAHQADMVQVVRDSADAREGVRAFGEKRPPVWAGR